MYGDGELKKELEFGEGKMENGKWNSIRREFFLEFKGEQIESKKISTLAEWLHLNFVT